MSVIQQLLIFFNALEEIQISGRDAMTMKSSIDVYLSTKEIAF